MSVKRTDPRRACHSGILHAPKHRNRLQGALRLYVSGDLWDPFVCPAPQVNKSGKGDNEFHLSI